MRHFVLGTIWRNNNTVADLQIVKQKKITVMEGRMKATRHNGRSGKHGSYNPKHNDRNFDLNHSEHIDANMAMQNIYWDCYTGKRTATSKGNYESFDAIELRFYEENYGAFVINQNERNARNRHTERNRMIEGIYQNKKTCPEESIYQLGTMDASVKPETLVKIRIGNLYIFLIGHYMWMKQHHISMNVMYLMHQIAMEKLPHNRIRHWSF